MLGDVVDALVATLRVLGALLLVFFLPGWLLVNALYPRKGELDREYDGLYRVTLGIVLSIAVTVFWGFFLNALGVSDPVTGLGYVQAPEITAGLVGLSVAFFVVGWWRGAYPWMGRLHESLARAPRPAPEDLLTADEKDAKVRLRLEDLASRREKLRRTIKDYERRMRLQSSDASSHYEERRDAARKELKRVEAELRDLEADRAKELYG